MSYFVAYTPELFPRQDASKGAYSPAADPFLKGGRRVDNRE